MFRIWAVIGLASILGGCAFSQSYQPNPYLGAESLELTPGVEPQVWMSSDFDADVNRLLEAGYMAVGYSAFKGAEFYLTGAGAKSKGKELGAQIVMLNSAHSHTTSTTTTVPVENPGQTVTSTTQGGELTVSLFTPRRPHTYQDRPRIRLTLQTKDGSTSRPSIGRRRMQEVCDSVPTR